jgi:ketosteroid isomerase-like protein
MTLNAAARDEIMKMLIAYGEAYTRKDLPGILSYFSPECCGYGTGPDEEARDPATFRAHLARDLDQCDHVTVRFDNVMLNGEGTVAWMMADCTYDLVIGGKKHVMTGRMTGVLRKTGNRWLFELVHLSMPYAGQEVGESYPGYG